MDINFIYLDEKFKKGAEEYFEIWKKYRGAIIEKTEENSGLRFKDEEVRAEVYDGVSLSGRRGLPMRLRYSYPKSIKKATLVHELSHRILPGRDWPGEIKDVHQVLNLFLYDTVKEIFGEDVAEEMVEKEKKYGERYKKSWDWALGFKTKEERQRKLEEILTL